MSSSQTFRLFISSTFSDMVLLGDRCGWEAVPARIPSTEFESLRAKATEDEGVPLDRWYVRDDNAVPPLKRRDEGFDEYHEWDRSDERL